jgi:glycosyltransferase involved in cell wall biosynthesis
LEKKIRVLTIHNRLHLGGPIFIIAYLTKYLPSEIYETKLVMGPPLPDEISADFFLKNENLSYIVIKEMIRSVDPLNDIRAFLKIRKIIKEFRPHVVHTHTAKAGTLGRLAAWSCGVPVTFHTFHGHVFHSYFSAPVNFSIKLFERTLAHFTTRVVTISDKQKLEICEGFKILSPDRCPVIPLGFDLDKFGTNTKDRRADFRKEYNLKNDELAVGIIGRFAPIKNHMLLFKAVTLIQSQQPDYFKKVVIFCIGDGELKADFQKFLVVNNVPFSDYKRLFTGGGIVFTSWVKQIEQILPGLDLVVLTSDNEGTPLSLIEAQAAGVPVLSTNVGGVEDVLIDKETGWLTPKGDAQVFADGILYAIINKHLLPQMGQKGLFWVNKEFSYNRLVADTDRMYRWNLRDKKITIPNLPSETLNLPKVTIITVCKNRKELISEAIKSVERQNYPNIEYIVIDGGSTDGTVEIISSHTRVNKYISEPDNGIYDAMNKGIRLASGEIIAFLNSDDSYYTNNIISEIVLLFQIRNADAIYGDIIYIDKDQEKIKRYWKAGDYRHNSFKWGWMPPHPAFFMRTNIFLKYGLFQEDLTLSADYELMLRLIHYHGIFIDYLPKIIVKMRLGGASNQNFLNRLIANKQDRMAWVKNKIKPNVFTILLKPLRKLPQWFLPSLMSRYLNK